MTPEFIKQFYDQGRWHPDLLYQLLDRHAERTPDALAIADQHERLTYSEFADQSKALASWLIEQDVAPGSVFAIQTGNRAALAIAHFACSRADLTFVPLSTQWRRTEMESLLRRSQGSVLVVPPPRKDIDFLATVNEIRGDLPELRLVGGLDGLPADFDFDTVLKTPATQPARPRTADDPRFITVTSGTTDIPRMSQWTDNNLSFLHRDYAEAALMGPGDVAVAIAPANTGATGYLFPVLAPLLCGAAAVLLENWSPAAAVQLLESEHATHAAAIPTQLVKMLQEDGISERDFSAVKVITSAGAPLTPDTAEQTEKTFGCAVTTVYGSTDGGVITVTRATDPVDKRRRTVGQPIAGAELVLRDPATGQLVPVGTSGETIWRTPTKSFGYLNDDERTEAMFRDDGWFYSGDLGSLDEDGYLSITGRSKDLIIRGGQNISPLELEQIIARHDAVSEVAVVGVPDPVFGERVCACVVPITGAELGLDDLVTYMRALNIALFKLPERLELFDELPRTAGGKLSKVTLRSAIAERAAAG
jgi:acyl-CoA synthetase (AMP-forming)/AMP-acid ligase II